MSKRSLFTRRLKLSVASCLPGNGFMAGKLSVTWGTEKKQLLFDLISSGLSSPQRCLSIMKRMLGGKRAVSTPDSHVTYVGQIFTPLSLIPRDRVANAEEDTQVACSFKRRRPCWCIKEVMEAEDDFASR